MSSQVEVARLVTKSVYRRLASWTLDLVIVIGTIGTDGAAFSTFRLRLRGLQTPREDEPGAMSDDALGKKHPASCRPLSFWLRTRQGCTASKDVSAKPFGGVTKRLSLLLPYRFISFPEEFSTSEIGIGVIAPLHLAYMP